MNDYVLANGDFRYYTESDLQDYLFMSWIIQEMKYSPDVGGDSKSLPYKAILTIDYGIMKQLYQMVYCRQFNRGEDANLKMIVLVEEGRKTN